MKTFNSYEPSWAIDKVYIKLNDDFFLYAGEFELFADDNDDDESGDWKWTPASVDDTKSDRRLGVQRHNGETFRREEKFDGYEFEFPKKFEKSIIRITLGGKNA